MDTRRGKAFGPTLSRRPTREDDSGYQEGSESRAGTVLLLVQFLISFVSVTGLTIWARCAGATLGFGTVSAIHRCESPRSAGG